MYPALFAEAGVKHILVFRREFVQDNRSSSASIRGETILTP
jgi:hypothetical protein